MTPNEPIVRPAVAGDLPAIVVMRNALNALELEGCPHASIQKLTLEQFAAHWGPTLDDPDYCWRVVQIDGELIGFGMIYLLKPKTERPGAFVQWAYVKQGRRREGIGQLLLEQMLSWARSRNVERVELQFIDGNQIAEHFWTKLGFRPYARKCVVRLS